VETFISRLEECLDVGSLSSSLVRADAKILQGTEPGELLHDLHWFRTRDCIINLNNGLQSSSCSVVNCRKLGSSTSE
jgi:hypothetical protein